MVDDEGIFAVVSLGRFPGLNGLRMTFQIMMDKAITVRTDKLGAIFGLVDDTAMQATAC